MDYYDYLCYLDQQRRELQAEIADECRVSGESYGGEGKDPEYPDNSTYMAGYEAGQQHYASLYIYGPHGERMPGVDPGDCHWLYTDEDFDEF